MDQHAGLLRALLLALVSIAATASDAVLEDGYQLSQDDRGMGSSRHLLAVVQPNCTGACIRGNARECPLETYGLADWRYNGSSTTRAFLNKYFAAIVAQYGVRGKLVLGNAPYRFLFADAVSVMCFLSAQSGASEQYLPLTAPVQIQVTVKTNKQGVKSCNVAPNYGVWVARILTLELNVLYNAFLPPFPSSTVLSRQVFPYNFTTPICRCQSVAETLTAAALFISNRTRPGNPRPLLPSYDRCATGVATAFHSGLCNQTFVTLCAPPASAAVPPVPRPPPAPRPPPGTVGGISLPSPPFVPLPPLPPLSVIPVFPYCQCNSTSANAPFLLSLLNISTDGANNAYCFQLQGSFCDPNNPCCFMSVFKMEFLINGKCVNQILSATINNGRASAAYDTYAVRGVTHTTVHLTQLQLNNDAVAGSTLCFSLARSGPCPDLGSFCYGAASCLYALFDGELVGPFRDAGGGQLVGAYNKYGDCCPVGRLSQELR